jgi:hypothetical protein
MLSSEITSYLQLGTTGALFAWFIYQYFQEQKVRSTLKDANAERKLDTDEVAKELNLKQDIDLGRIDERLKIIETNHLVHIQKSLDENVKDHSDIRTILIEVKTKVDLLLKQ